MHDLVTSNNADRDVVLATVANTIHDFCNHLCNHCIFATGSTPVRIRLYQRGISRFIIEIQKDFDVCGLIGNELHPFDFNVNYSAFLVVSQFEFDL